MQNFENPYTLDEGFDVEVGDLVAEVNSISFDVKSISRVKALWRNGIAVLANGKKVRPSKTGLAGEFGGRGCNGSFTKVDWQKEDLARANMRNWHEKRESIAAENAARRKAALQRYAARVAHVWEQCGNSFNAAQVIVIESSDTKLIEVRTLPFLTYAEIEACSTLDQDGVTSTRTTVRLYVNVQTITHFDIDDSERIIQVDHHALGFSQSMLEYVTETGETFSAHTGNNLINVKRTDTLGIAQLLAGASLTVDFAEIVYAAVSAAY